jgi:hypothetical protein
MHVFMCANVSERCLIVCSICTMWVVVGVVLQCVHMRISLANIGVTVAVDVDDVAVVSVNDEHHKHLISPCVLMYCATVRASLCSFSERVVVVSLFVL